MRFPDRSWRGAMERKETVDKFLQKGILLQPKALDKALKLPPDVVDRIISDLVARGVQIAGEEDLEPRAVPEEKPLAAQIEIVQEAPAPTSDSRIDYLRYFQNRFDRLAALVRRKPTFEASRSISEVKSGETGPVATIGMICDKAATSGGHMAFMIEDGTGRIRVFVPRNLPEIEIARKLVLDEVIGVQGSYDPGKKVLVARGIVSPDIEEQKGALASQRVYAVFLSDLHFGSEDFMAGAFSAFVEWLQGRSGDPPLREISRLTRYVVICGDLIQGGSQLLERYTRLAGMLRGIPQDVLILAIPGEQDVAAMLEPQSGFLDEALKAFSDLRNFRPAGNPCWARLGGVPVLLYHGRSLEDWASSLGTEEPCELLREIMVRRHMAPIYGSAVPLAPVGRDPFLIGEVPRIFQVGHTHRKCSSRYKGVLLLSSPSWKASEGERGAGTVYVVDLSSLESREINFGPGAKCA